MTPIEARVELIDESSGRFEDSAGSIEVTRGKVRVKIRGLESVFVYTDRYWTFGIASFICFLLTRSYLVRADGIRRVSGQQLELEPYGKFEFKVIISVSESAILDELEASLKGEAVRNVASTTPP